MLGPCKLQSPEAENEQGYVHEQVDGA